MRDTRGKSVCFGNFADETYLRPISGNPSFQDWSDSSGASAWRLEHLIYS